MGIKLNVILTNCYHEGEKKVNDVRKIIGLLVMLPLFTISLTVAGQIEAVDAANVGSIDIIGRPGYQPDKVCGDRLCSEISGGKVAWMEQQRLSTYVAPFEAKILEDKSEILRPYFDLVDIQKASANSENTFNAIFDVWAGEQNITDLKMLVKSDLETTEVGAGSFHAGDHSITIVKITATDLNSISGEIIDFKVHTGSENHLGSSVSAKKMNLAVGNNMIVEAKSLDGSYFELFDMTSLGSDLYKVTLVMYAGPEEISIGSVLHASSDSANKLVYVPRVTANSQDWLSVIISADDPSTIRIE